MCFPDQSLRDIFMTRVSVLSKQEVKEFDQPQIFNSVERKRFFYLDGALRKELNSLRTQKNKVLFIVSYAHFKANKRFYDGAWHEKDLEYAASLLDLNFKSLGIIYYPKQTRQNHQRLILQLWVPRCKGPNHAIGIFVTSCSTRISLLLSLAKSNSILL